MISKAQVKPLRRSCTGRSSLNEYTIYYADGTTRTLTCTGPAPQGDWIIFADGTGELLRDRAIEVVSIARAGVPERTGKTAKAA